MTCDEIQLELCAYHFGVVSDETRQSIEDHLTTCPGCLRAFLSVKREIETAPQDELPSPASRAKLRQAVAEELRLHRGASAGGEQAQFGIAPRRRWSWWERPLAFGFAAAAVLLAMIVVGVLATGPGAIPHGWHLAQQTAPAVSR